MAERRAGLKVNVLGAGPAGLYLAILLRKADREHEITVVERNAPDATFGWGVVFSEETLGALRDADPKTYLEITDTFARWDTVDINYRGQLLRARGHTFSAIARKQLLAILQRRCRELGVRLEFGVEVDDPAGLAELAASADLLVAADGVNSIVRRWRGDAFGSRVRPQGCKYVWFGTDLVFDAFTFIFRQTEFGLFQVHAYPFDERTSTFIVECPEPTWRRAGLDAMTEAESIAFGEKLFAEDLAGHRLLSNRIEHGASAGKSISTRWLDFQRVSNTSWHQDNVVLLGDAAHTAHFTIGSGTKLAMEDAIALANALVLHEDLGAALVAYELERMPVVERFQQAADDSAAYFGRVGNHTDLEPPQFAFNLLTRSGRISHANLTMRDPGFIRRLDSWFAGGRAPVAPPPMFAPLAVGGVTVGNRVVRPARTPDGAGLALTGLVAVSPDGRVSPRTPALCSPADADALRPVVARAHGAGALAAVRLGHAGRRGSTRPPANGVDIPLPPGDRWPLLSASALPYLPGGPAPGKLDAAGMARLVETFAAAAELAGQAGFDAVELDLAHGYLLASFLSPLSNRRTDDHGGPLPNRLRFPIRVLAAVRAAWPGLLIARLTVTDWARGGLTVDEGVEAAMALAGDGADLIHVEAGQTVPDGRPEYRRGFLTGLSDRVRNEAKVPTLVGGYLTTPDEANTVVAAGRADLCLLDLPDT